MKNEATTVNEYDQQATDFLARNGLKMRITLSDSKTPAWAKDGEETGHHYRVTITRALPQAMRTDTESVLLNLSRLVFDFWGSVADAKALPEAERRLQDMQLQLQNMEPHYRLNWQHALHARKESVRQLHASPYDVLACISGDVYTPETFADFCSEYGYEEDSIKALQQFRRCDRFAKRLRAFFTDQELEELGEIQ